MTRGAVATGQIRAIPGGSITSPLGYKAAGVCCGLKRSEKPDLAILYSEIPAAVAGVYTTNLVHAACVDINRDRVASGKAQAIVVNSGNANCFTGEQGRLDALQMCSYCASKLGIDENLSLGASTGVIGEALPLDKVKTGIDLAVAAIGEDGGPDAARAIMTTDTVPKTMACEVGLSNGSCTIGIMAKGSGMIDPNLATMLAFVTTDAWVPAEALQVFLNEAVARSFNCVTVDGDSSTNDMVIALANGAGGVAVEKRDAEVFASALLWLCREMAKAIAADGEGATKLVEIRVTGALSEDDAKLAAKTIANSPLVKTALFGNDPNWGRIVAAAGRSGCKLDVAGISLIINGASVVISGEPAKLNPSEKRKLLEGNEVLIELSLGVGDSECIVWTCDMSYDYVKINAEYHT